MSGDVDGFIATAKMQGVTDATIASLLKHNGWSDRRVYRSLSAYYQRTLGIEVPGRPTGADNARDAFIYVLNFVTLGFWTTALGRLCYILIDRAFPDVQAYRRYYEGVLVDQIAWQLAAIIITLPTFLIINAYINRELLRRPELYESGVRAWLTYAALVIGSVIVLIDAIWFLEALLRGALTLHFVLDTLVLLVIGGGVLAYYGTGLKATKEG